MRLVIIQDRRLSPTGLKDDDSHVLWHGRNYLERSSEFHLNKKIMVRWETFDGPASSGTLASHEMMELANRLISRQPPSIDTK